MIRYFDFVPPQFSPAGFLRSAQYGTLEQALDMANQWIQQAGVKVINIETVVLPNIHRQGEEGSSDPALRTSGEVASYWHQFIRVWYETP